jgi:hypothetical protein
MTAKFTFTLASSKKNSRLPHKLLIAQDSLDSVADVALKLLSYLIFFRERLQLETDLHLLHLPFVPNLVQLDYSLNPVFWVECGECEIKRLKKLAVKIPDAEIWIVLGNADLAEELIRKMKKAKLRPNRYSILAFDADMFIEFCSLLHTRSTLFWHTRLWDPPNLQFELDTVWFDAPFSVTRF